MMKKKRIYLLWTILLILILITAALPPKKIALQLQNNFFLKDSPLMLGTTAIYKPNNWLLLILREKPNTEASYYGLLPTKFFGYTFQEIDGRFLLFIVMDDGYESNHIFFQEMKPEEQRKAKLLLNSCVINPSQFNCTFMRIGKWVAIKSPLMDPGRLRIIWVPDLGITITLADTEIKYLEAIRLEAR